MLKMLQILWKYTSRHNSMPSFARQIDWGRSVLHFVRLRWYGQTNRRGETEMCHFESYHRDSTTSYCSCCKSPRRPRKLHHNLSDHWPFRIKLQCVVKKQNLITVHILTSYPVFISSWIGHKTKNKKIFQNVGK